MSRAQGSPLGDADRRRFLQHAALAVGASVLPVPWSVLARTARAAASAMESEAGFANLDAAQAADLEAIAGRIIPADDTPGAREAGVIHFIDQAMGGFMAPAAESLRAGLAELNDAVAADGLAERFADLSAGAQDAALTRIEDGEFFALVRFLTIAGFLCLPSQGGNRDAIGWKLLGFEQRHVWQPPFGHYDAETPAAGGGDHE